LSGEPARSQAPAAAARHRLLVSSSVAKRYRTAATYGGAVCLLGTAVTYFDSRQFDLVFLLLGVVLVLLAVGLHFGIRRFYVQLQAGTLLIHGLLREEQVPVSAIRQVRTQTLRVVFSAPSRKGLMLRSLRPFEQSPALVLRLDMDVAEVAKLGKLAGRGTVLDHDLILLVADAQGLDSSLQPQIRRRPPAPAAHRR